MKAYIQLTIAQLRIFSRNRSVIFFSLLFPILLMVALGTFLGNGNNASLHTLVLDQDQSPASKQFVGAMLTQSIMTTAIVDNEPAALDDLRKGDAQLVVVLPKGYGQQVDALRGSIGSNSPNVQVRVYYDETNMATSQIGLTVLNQVADQVNKQLVHYEQHITIQPEGIQSIQLKYIDFLVPGIVAMMIMSTNLNGVAGQIAAWRERGILRRMQSTTLHPSTFIAAQITSRLILNGLQASIVLLIANIFFGTQMNGNWFLLFGFVILGTLTFMSIGFIIAGLAKTPESAAPIAGLISFPMLFLGNVFFPIKNMPGIMQPIVEAIPITHLSTSLRQVMNVGASLSDLWLDASILGAWLLVAFIIASFTFKWE